MPNTPFDIVAVDVSKDSLQIKSDSCSLKIRCNPEDLARLLVFIKSLPNPFVVCEATGGYERFLLDALHKAKIPCRAVNPARVRAFAASEGIRAKTDPIDAGVILRFAHEKKLQPAPPPSALQQQLAAHLDRRNQLNMMASREKNHLENASKLAIQSITRHLKFLQKEVLQIEQKIRLLISSEPSLKIYTDTMTSVSGVGELTAWTILAYLSEITELGRNEVVALAGVAPYNRDSGKTSAKRSIFGGRAKVRKCLFMAAKSAAVHNAVIRPYVQGLRDRGKPYKCAIVAAMRKLLLYIQSLLKKSQLSLAT